MKSNQKKGHKKLLKEFISMLKVLDEVMVNVSRKKHFNDNIISKKLEHIDEKIDAYLRDFLTEDNHLTKQEITKKLEVYQ